MRGNLKDGEKNADRLGTLGSEAQSGDELPVFSFSFMVPRSGAEEAGILEMSKGANKQTKSPQHKLK